MTPSAASSRFEAKLLRPVESEKGARWAFVILPKVASATLPRRGRTTIEGTINDQGFQSTLEPDGQLRHWLTVDAPLLEAAGVGFGDTVSFEIRPVEQEPEPELPGALAASPPARAGWDDTTTLARLDWIHWITSAKQAKTRAQRVQNACEMLGSAKRRVCCFDPSGYYSKAFSAPKAANE